MRQTFMSGGRRFHVGQLVSASEKRGAPILLQHRTWIIAAQAPDPDPTRTFRRLRGDAMAPGSGSWLWLQDAATGQVSDAWRARVSWLEPA